MMQLTNKGACDGAYEMYNLMADLVEQGDPNTKSVIGCHITQQTLRFMACSNEEHNSNNLRVDLFGLACFPDNSISLGVIESPGVAFFIEPQTVKSFKKIKTPVTSELIKFAEPNTAHIAVGVNNSWGIYKILSADPSTWERVG